MKVQDLSLYLLGCSKPLWTINIRLAALGGSLLLWYETQPFLHGLQVSVNVTFGMYECDCVTVFL